MIKQFQKVKIFVVFMMLFYSSLFVFCPIGKSGPLDQIYQCTPSVIFEYNQTLLQQPVVPYDQPRVIPITVKAKVSGPASDIVLDKIGPGTGTILIIHMSIAEVSEGCHASINPPIVELDVSDQYVSTRYDTPSKQYIPINATLSLTIDKYLPAFSLENVKVRMESDPLGIIVKPGNFTQDLPFFVGYYPQLSFSYPNGNVKSISPSETAYFTVGLKNFGNAATNVTTEIVDVPKGWHASIPENITLGTNLTVSNFEGTISLNVKPPINFGYHEDRAVIKVKMTPVCYNNSAYVGEPYYLSFIVQSKGFSTNATPGFETGIVLLAFIFVLFPIWKRKNNKIKKEQAGGRKK